MSRVASLADRARRDARAWCPTGWPLVLAFALGFAWAWVGTAPSVGMGLNWDTATYVAHVAGGHYGWSHVPWTSHLAIGQVYLLGDGVAGLFGGTPIQGARLMNALALGVTCLVMMRLLRVLGVGRLLGFAGVALFLSTWGICRLVFTVEDNVLYMPFAAAVGALASANVQKWTPRLSLTTGILGACGWLMSWQAAVYLTPALLCAVVFGGPRLVGRRVRDVSWLIVGFVATVGVWVLFTGLVCRSPWVDLLSAVVARPQPSFFPTSAQEWITLLRRPGAMGLHIGAGLQQTLGEHLLPFTTHRALRRLGGLFAFLVATQALIVTGRRVFAHGRTDASDRGLLLAWTLVVLTAAAALYLDLLADKYKRYEFLPLFLAPALVVAIANLTSRVGRAVRVIAVTVAALQTLQASRVNERWHDGVATILPARYAGVGRVSWYGYIHELSRAHPQACRFVFTLNELEHARFQAEIPAALLSELPAYVALANWDEVEAWETAESREPDSEPRQQEPSARTERRCYQPEACYLRFMDPARFGDQRRPCDWLSPAAAQRLVERAGTGLPH